jgi:CubicO group peptidase (beta-lactamase class C family)
MAALAELGFEIGPPAPATVPAPDERMRRIGSVPLEYQPGERWLYEVSADVLGVLVARASEMSFDAYLRERVFEPLGMSDTGFFVASDAIDRFGPCFIGDPRDGSRVEYDGPDGQWSTPPAFPGGGDGLVSTVADYLAFGGMLLAGGTSNGVRVLSRPSVEAMTTDQLTDEQRRTSGPDPTGSLGWGFGVGVLRQRVGTTWSAGTYSWDGGLGSTWANDPAEDLIGVLLTNQAWTSPTPPAVCDDFWTAAYAAISDAGS